MNASKVFITTSIPYVNAPAHVGHAQEFVLADSLARLHRNRGHEVILQTGTDENAFKNVLSAQEKGIDPVDFVAQNSARFRELADLLDVSYNTFIRTTETRHLKGVHLFWRTLNPSDLYTKTYRGLYCQGCEDFYLEKDLVDGVCPDHRSKPQSTEEENVFFRLSRYQTELDHLIANDRIRITPTSRKNEILAFIRSGLQDISLTRDASRSQGWGIRTPDNPKQVIYVWIDALINYLSGQGYGSSDEWKNVWNEPTRKIHVIGKNVWKFHAVYWPALLLSAGLPLPNEIVIHGFLTVNGQKISKSLGNAIDPIAVIGAYGVDAFRNYILSDLSIFGDADFSDEGLRQSYNSNLANNLGNLVSRLAALSRRADHASRVSAAQSRANKREFAGADQLQTLLRQLWDDLSDINAEINSTRPWELIKSGEHEASRRLVDSWVERLASIGDELQCFAPSAGRKLLNLTTHGVSKIATPLFPRI
jgi:methionyl-tRNA synthetase